MCRRVIILKKSTTFKVIMHKIQNNNKVSVVGSESEKKVLYLVDLIQVPVQVLDKRVSPSNGDAQSSRRWKVRVI